MSRPVGRRRSALQRTGQQHAEGQAVLCHDIAGRSGIAEIPAPSLTGIAGHR